MYFVLFFYASRLVPQRNPCQLIKVFLSFWTTRCPKTAWPLNMLSLILTKCQFCRGAPFFLISSFAINFIRVFKRFVRPTQKSLSMSSRTSPNPLSVLKVCSYTVTFREQFFIYPCWLQCHLFLYPHVANKIYLIKCLWQALCTKPMDKPHLLLQKAFILFHSKALGKIF